MLEVPAEPEDLLLLASEDGGDEGLAHGFAAPVVEVVEGVGELAAAVVGQESLEAENLAADPGGLGRGERGMGRSLQPRGSAALAAPGGSAVPEPEDEARGGGEKNRQGDEEQAGLRFLGRLDHQVRLRALRRDAANDRPAPTEVEKQAGKGASRRSWSSSQVVRGFQEESMTRATWAKPTPERSGCSASGSLDAGHAE